MRPWPRRWGGCSVTDESLRLFLALWPDAAARRALQAAARTAISASGGWPVPAVNYHLTLAFLGRQPRSNIGAIADAVARQPTLEGTLRLTRVGCFRGARVLWAGPERTPHGLARAVLGLRVALEDNGVQCAPGPFRVHVTLARRIARAPAVTAIEPVRWHYSGITLVQSEGGRAPYRILQKWSESGSDTME